MKTKAILTIILAAAATALASCAGAGSTSPVAGAVKPYPGDTCVLTDNKLGSMGPPITKVYGDQEVKFCCKPCVAKFEKNPGKFLADLRE